jgi:molybdenum cofactor synthesis domain-containing protein
VTPTAAILIIGNEVLSAQLADENGPYLLQRLRALGVRVMTLRVLSDRFDAIVEAVAHEHSRATWVFTSGGIGPTHDDITVSAVAAALGKPLVRSQAVATAIRTLHRQHLGDAPFPESALRMADLPEGARVIGDGFPLAVAENVVMLPGVPQFLRHQFERFAREITAEPFRTAAVYLDCNEAEVALALDRVATAHSTVEIGSYPRFDDADYKVKVTFEAKDADAVAAARDALLGQIPRRVVLRQEMG